MQHLQHSVRTTAWRGCDRPSYLIMTPRERFSWCLGVLDQLQMNSLIGYWPGQRDHVTPTDALTPAKTATGGEFHSDGRIVVLALKNSSDKSK